MSILLDPVTGFLVAPPPPPNPGLLRTARYCPPASPISYHELGHALVARHFGRAVQAAYADGQGGQSFSDLSTESAEDLRVEAAVFCGGAVAALLYTDALHTHDAGTVAGLLSEGDRKGLNVVAGMFSERYGDTDEPWPCPFDAACRALTAAGEEVMHPLARLLTAAGKLTGWQIDAVFAEVEAARGRQAG